MASLEDGVESSKCGAGLGKKNGKEVDFITERYGDKIYLLVALRITEIKTMEREFGTLKTIKDNFPKHIITLDEYTGSSHEGIRHIPLQDFLLEFDGE